MKIILAPDSFKGTMTSIEVIEIMKSKLLTIDDVEIIEMPIADGGEGTLATLLGINSGKKVLCEVHDPLMRKISTYFAIVGETAVIEMALASGLTLLDESERNPVLTSTYGTGELILQALNHGVSKIIIGIGGSATNDGGIGMASALGVQFLDENNDQLIANGMYLDKIHAIDFNHLDKRIYDVDIEVMCDVNNVLTGSQGATYTYGPQKGATEDMLLTLEKGMMNLSQVIKKQLAIDLQAIEGSGAAGGLGGGIIAFLNGQLKSGIETILELNKFAEEVKTADYVITGEGKLDKQTLQGKVIHGIRRFVDGTSCKLIIVAGYSEMDELEGAFIVSTTDRQYDEAYLKEHAKENLKNSMDDVIDYVRSQND